MDFRDLSRDGNGACLMGNRGYKKGDKEMPRSFSFLFKVDLCIKPNTQDYCLRLLRIEETRRTIETSLDKS